MYSFVCDAALIHYSFTYPSFTALLVKKTRQTSKSPQPKRISQISPIRTKRLLLRTQIQTCQNPLPNQEQHQLKFKKDGLPLPIKISIIWKSPLVLELVQKMKGNAHRPQIHRDWAEMYPKTMVKMRVQIRKQNSKNYNGSEKLERLGRARVVAGDPAPQRMSWKRKITSLKSTQTVRKRLVRGHFQPLLTRLDLEPIRWITGKAWQTQHWERLKNH